MIVPYRGFASGKTGRFLPVWEGWVTQNLTVEVPNSGRKLRAAESS
jgi:hypothetical protein